MLVCFYSVLYCLKNIPELLGTEPGGRVFAQHAPDFHPQNLQTQNRFFSLALLTFTHQNEF